MAEVFRHASSDNRFSQEKSDSSVCYGSFCLRRGGGESALALFKRAEGAEKSFAPNSCDNEILLVLCQAGQEAGLRDYFFERVRGTAGMVGNV